MLAYHNDPAVKAKYLRRVRAHAKADRIIQGTGWDNGRGCAIGCTLEAYDHARYPIELGIPVGLARLEDQIFERLPESEAMKWPAAFLSAIPVGADLTLVWPRFALWLLRGGPERSLELPAVKSAVDGVAALFERWVNTGDKPPVADWRAARSASSSSSAYAAGTDYDAYAAYAVDAAYAHRSFWNAAAKELLRLLRAPSPEEGERT
jgi:hypothetical protein